MLTKKFAIAVLLIATAAFAAGAQTKAPLTHEKMWGLKRVGAPAPSPDGKWVIFRANFEGNTDVYAVELNPQTP